MQARHLHASFHQAEGSKTCLELQFIISAIFCFLAHWTHQSEVGGGDDPVDGEGGEEDEGPQQGQAEVEAACSQARTSHPQNLISGVQRGIVLNSEHKSWHKIFNMK